MKVESSRPSRVAEASPSPKPESSVRAREGQTVKDLAAENGTSEDEVRRLNPQLREVDELQEGQEVRLPEPAARDSATPRAGEARRAAEAERNRLVYENARSAPPPQTDRPVQDASELPRADRDAQWQFKAARERENVGFGDVSLARMHHRPRRGLSVPESARGLPAEAWSSPGPAARSGVQPGDGGAGPAAPPPEAGAPEEARRTRRTRSRKSRRAEAAPATEQVADSRASGDAKRATASDAAQAERAAPRVAQTRDASAPSLAPDDSAPAPAARAEDGRSGPQAASRQEVTTERGTSDVTGRPAGFDPSSLDELPTDVDVAPPAAMPEADAGLGGVADAATARTAAPATPAGGAEASSDAEAATADGASTIQGLTEEEANRIGTAWGNQRPPQAVWTEQAVNTLNERGLEQGKLSQEQADKNAAIAGQIFNPGGEVDPATPAVEVNAADVAALARESGASLEKLDGNQLNAATNYINEGKTLGEQQERTRKALNNFSILEKGMPQLTMNDIKGSLWDAARVPGHALDNCKGNDLQKAYQDVAAATNTPGSHEVKVGKHKVSFNVDENSKVSGSSTKKEGFWSKVGGFFKKVGQVALTVASFIPGPIGIAARIGNAVVGAVKAAKSGSVLGAVAGVAGAIAGGAGAIAGKATEGVARTVATVAGGVSRAAQGVQAGLNAYKAKNLGGVLSGIAGAASGAAGALSTVAGGIANTANRVADWARGGASAVKAIDAARRGDALGALSAAADGAASVASGAGQSDLAKQISRVGNYAHTAEGVRNSVRSGDYLSAASQITGLAAREVADPALQGQLATASKVLHGADQATDAIQRGDYLRAAEAGTDIAANLTRNKDLAAARDVLAASGDLRDAVKSGDAVAMTQAAYKLGDTVHRTADDFAARHFPPETAATRGAVQDQERLQAATTDAARARAEADRARTELASLAEHPRAVGGFQRIAQDGLQRVDDARASLDKALAGGEAAAIEQGTAALDAARADAELRSKTLQGAFAPVALVGSPLATELDLPPPPAAGATDSAPTATVTTSTSFRLADPPSPAAGTATANGSAPAGPTAGATPSGTGTGATSASGAPGATGPDKKQDVDTAALDATVRAAGLVKTLAERTQTLSPDDLSKLSAAVDVLKVAQAATKDQPALAALYAQRLGGRVVGFLETAENKAAASLRALKDMPLTQSLASSIERNAASLKRLGGALKLPAELYDFASNVKKLTTGSDWQGKSVNVLERASAGIASLYGAQKVGRALDAALSGMPGELAAKVRDSVLKQLPATLTEGKVAEIVAKLAGSRGTALLQALESGGAKALASGIGRWLGPVGIAIDVTRMEAEFAADLYFKARGSIEEVFTSQANGGSVAALQGQVSALRPYDPTDQAAARQANDYYRKSFLANGSGAFAGVDRQRFLDQVRRYPEVWSRFTNTKLDPANEFWLAQRLSDLAERFLQQKRSEMDSWKPG